MWGRGLSGLVGVVLLLGSSFAAAPDARAASTLSCANLALELPTSAATTTGTAMCTDGADAPASSSVQFTGQRSCSAAGVSWTGTLVVTVPGSAGLTTGARLAAADGGGSPVRPANQKTGTIALDSAQSGSVVVEYQQGQLLGPDRDSYCDTYRPSAAVIDGSFGPSARTGALTAGEMYEAAIGREEPASAECTSGGLGATSAYRVFGNRAIGRDLAGGAAILVGEQLIWARPAGSTDGSSITDAAFVDPGVRLGVDRPTSTWVVRTSDGVRATAEGPGSVVFRSRSGRAFAYLVALEGPETPAAVTTDGEEHHITLNPGGLGELSGVSDVGLVAAYPEAFGTLSMCGRPDLPAAPAGTAPAGRSTAAAAPGFNTCPESFASDPTRNTASRPMRISAFGRLRCDGPLPYTFQSRLEVKRRKFGPFFHWPLLSYDEATSTRSGRTIQTGVVAACRRGNNRYRHKFREGVKTSKGWRFANYAEHPSQPEFSCSGNEGVG
jgi:hypothetical protein